MEYQESDVMDLDRRPLGELSTYPVKSALNLDEEYPILRSLYTDFETTYKAGPCLVWTIGRYYVAPTAVTLYLLFCYFGTKWMKNRPAYDLRRPLKYWNLLLAVFSFMGMSRVVPHLFEILRRWGFEVSICSPPVYTYGHGACGLWVFLFIYSKYFELLDTVFIILRKRPLNFLHWYHHATVLLYTWDGYCVEQPAGIYFIAMNYSVHAVMYFYYFLAAQLQRPLSWGIFVTIAQISQMFVGVGVTCASLYYAFAYPLENKWTVAQFTDPLSHGQYINSHNLFYGLLMYSTYLYLFAEYFIKRYVSGSSSHKKIQARKAE
ncbi:putative integral membrane protein, GNS1/SUR4 family protein [Besnoitia besnoiti]|uniref:Elongation of fatty acids protein n=1 Tax=Besnoitia besnoiti TaxID=94643 RepID=A0A2A9LZ31_BESBE|nr:putative integral membrane protein, GNS1/SUR4 family protein [Besnoitia besnoiti]PFH31045.1 putative integral membrane protein, GNS1/SUR4 family protein [Besnoitia besnoiti]